jgi:glycosyltransferase involved in cell wall biosynthesis
MRVLLTSNATHLPPRGGSTRSNLAWLRHLAAVGHACVVVCPAPDGQADQVVEQDGITHYLVRDLGFRPAELGRIIRSTQPDWVLVSSEDVTHVLLGEASAASPGRVVYLAHTPQFLPFGPESWHADAAATARVRAAASVVVIGHHMAGYVEQHLGRRPAVVHPPIYGQPPYRQFGRFGAGFVLMINPCAVKGLGLFLEIAARFPDVEFAALRGWGTTAADARSLAALPNTRLLENVSNIEDVLCQARLLLMPSVWYEGFGLIAMEALLRGLPVVSSDSGGLAEAKHGTGYVVPVRAVERYEPVFDDTRMPRAVIPAQDVEPWVAALKRLLADETEYRAEAERSRAAALAFVERLDAADFERHLNTLTPAAEPIAADPARALDAAKRALLLARLKKKGRP